MTNSTFTSKIILITGCSSGIGLETARTLAQRGHRVFGTIRKEKDAAALQAAGCETLMMDINNSDSIKQALNTLWQKTNHKLDVLVNNAGFEIPGAVEDISRQALRDQFETNVFGLQEVTNLVIPTMRKQGSGRIINISSMLGFASVPFRGAYNATKYAVEALSDALRVELRDTGIKVCLIEPGPIKSHLRETAHHAYEKYIDVENSANREVYKKLTASMDARKENSSMTLTPADVAQKIVHAAESPRPKIRYLVTIPAYALAFLKRILPSCAFDWFMTQISKHEIKASE